MNGFGCAAGTGSIADPCHLRHRDSVAFDPVVDTGAIMDRSVRADEREALE